MNLSKFIIKSMEPILLEWEDFAATLVPEEQRMDRVMLRDHGKNMLETIALDLSKSETAQEKSKKSKGEAVGNGKRSAAKIHGSDRLALGFTLNSAVAEYRALRASVIRLWEEEIKKSSMAHQSFEELIRFNEAIDQAIAESVTSYSLEKDQQTRIFNTILSSSPDLSFTFSPAGNITYGNRSFLEFFERSMKEVLGKKWTDLVTVGGSKLQDHIKAVVQRKESSHGEVLLPNNIGNEIVFDCIFVPVITEDGKLESVAGTLRDITDRKIADDKNWQKANHDELTGLPNRSLFADRLEQSVLHSGRTGSKIALLFIDLDHFKEVNDTLGHDVGDLLLKFAADRIRSCVREADTVARLGGDEFTVILHNVVDVPHIKTVAKKIVKEMANAFQIFEHSVAISASVGVSLSPQDAITTTSLMKNADLAMYAAKSSGRNRVEFFSPKQLGGPSESTFGRL